MYSNWTKSAGSKGKHKQLLDKVEVYLGPTAKYKWYCLYQDKAWSITGQTIYLNPCPAEPGYPAFANSEDPDQLASKDANWSGSALFAI